MMKIVNQTVPMALEKLGYTPAAGRGDHRLHRRERDDRRRAAPQGVAPAGVRLRVQGGARAQRSIHYMGHIKMMGATQPFISGAISKTVNVPKDATVEEIKQAYIESWQLGAKAVSIYRDGSKRTQPLNTSKDKTAGGARAGGRRALVDAARSGASCRTSATRSRTSSTSPGHEGYITVGLFEDGQPGEIFLVMAKEGSTISGFADAFAQAISLRAAVRRAAAGAGRQVQPRPLRAVGDDAEPGDPLREVDRRLHLPLDGGEVPVAGGAVPRRRQRPRELDDDAASSCRSTSRRPRRRVGAGGRCSRATVAVLDDSEPGRRAAVLDLRLDHDPQRRLLQVQQLREHVRLRVRSGDLAFRLRESGRCAVRDTRDS